MDVQVKNNFFTCLVKAVMHNSLPTGSLVYYSTFIASTIYENIETLLSSNPKLLNIIMKFLGYIIMLKSY